MKFDTILDILQEKKNTSKIDWVDEVHFSDLETISQNVMNAINDLKFASMKIKDKKDLEKLNKCIMGMRGSSYKIAELAQKAKKDIN